MYFNKWLNFQESSYSDLYKSTVEAFPRTKKRQHATDPIKILEIKTTPYVGFKTILFRSSVLNTNENTKYNCLMLFKNVNYQGNQVKIKTQDLKEYSFDRLSFENTDVLLRCNCPDFRWRFSWYDKIDKSLYGRPPSYYKAKGVGYAANPMELEGMCKHLIKMAIVLKESNFFIEN
jgi:hypothetical protein